MCNLAPKQSVSHDTSVSQQRRVEAQVLRRRLGRRDVCQCCSHLMKMPSVCCHFAWQNKCNLVYVFRDGDTGGGERGLGGRQAE